MKLSQSNRTGASLLQTEVARLLDVASLLQTEVARLLDVDRIDVVLLRMRGEGLTDHDSYRNLRSKRDAIAEGKPYSVVDAGYLIGEAGGLIGKLTKRTLLRRST